MSVGRSIENIWSIARKELRSYFSSPIAYIIIALFLFIMGWMFFFNLEHFYRANFQFKAMKMGQAPNITDGLIRPLYGNMNVIFLFLVPLITMRLFAEEKKNQTIQLLLTSPVRLWEIVTGKFLSSFLFVGIMVGVTLVYPLMILLTSNVDTGPILTSVVGIMLMSGCLLALGTLFTAMTENQIVAGALTFVAGLFFWLVSWAQQAAGPVWSEILEHLSLISHFNNFGQGIINSTDVIYYLSFIGASLFVTHRVLDSYRWR